MKRTGIRFDDHDIVDITIKDAEIRKDKIINLFLSSLTINCSFRRARKMAVARHLDRCY